MAMQIPEYVAERELNTERSTIPNIPAMDQVGRALENLGSSFAEFGAHLNAKAKQKKDTEDAIAYETTVQKNQRDSFDTVNENEDPAGEGIYDAGQAKIDANNAAAIAKMSPENQKIYGSKLAINKSDNGMWLETQQHEQARGHYGEVTKGIVGNKAVDVGANPHKWQEHLDDSYKFIDGLPNLYPAEKTALKKQAYEALANGKMQGEIDRDPAGAKTHLGVPGQETKSLSGAKVPSGSGNGGMRGKQLGFVWHELNGPAGKHGGSSEQAAYNRLKKAGSLEAAVSAGLTFERPSIPNFAGRLNHARRVLAGKAGPEAMQARAYFESKGMSPIQASGFVGVLMGESGSNLNPNAANPKDPGTSIGIAQWNRDRKANMLAFTGASAGEWMPDPKGLTKQVVDPAYEQMPAEWRIMQLNRADSALNSANSAQATAAKAKVTQTFQDQYTATVANGRYEGDSLTKQDYYDAYPKDPAVAEENFGLYQRTMGLASKIHSFQNMTLNELVAQREKTLDMVGVGPGAAEQAKFQEAELAALDFQIAGEQTQVKSVYEARQEQMRVATEAATVRAKDAEKYWEEKRKQQIADFKTIVERQIKDDSTSFEMDPAYSGAIMSPDVFKRVWPGKEGEQRYKDYILGLQGSKMRAGLGDAPTRELLAQRAQLDKTMKGAAGQDTSALINEAVLTQNAIEKELKAREEDPAGYVLQNNPVVSTAFEEAQKDPNSVKKSEYAIELMLANQRYLGIPEDKLAPLPKYMVDNISGVFNNPEANVLNATAPLIRAIELTTDKSARAAIMKQAIKAGVKSNASEGMIAYLDGRGPEAMRLFDAARIDDTVKGNVDDTKNSEIYTKLAEVLMSDRASTEWGRGYQDNGQRAFDLQKLGFNYVKKAMFKGMTANEAIERFSNDIFGNKVPVVRVFRGGISTNFSLPPDEDAELITDGLASLRPNIENAIKTLIQGPMQGFGTRPDGTPKGSGYFGVLKRPDGSVSTEISMSTDAIGGKEFPLLVPTLTKSEVNQLLSMDISDPKKIPTSIVSKAEAFAKQRVTEGKSPFASPEESPGYNNDEAIQRRISQEILINSMSQTGVWISYNDGFAFSTDNGLLRNADGSFYTVTMEEAKSAGIESPPALQPHGKGVPSGQ